MLYIKITYIKLICSLATPCGWILLCCRFHVTLLTLTLVLARLQQSSISICDWAQSQHQSSRGIFEWTHPLSCHILYPPPRTLGSAAIVSCICEFSFGPHSWWKYIHRSGPPPVHTIAFLGSPSLSSVCFFAFGSAQPIMFGGTPLS